jgi:hypothetical protein
MATETRIFWLTQCNGNLMLGWLCILNYMNNNQHEALFIFSLLSYELSHLYMFRAYQQHIIRRQNVYTWQTVLVLLSWLSSGLACNSKFTAYKAVYILTRKEEFAAVTVPCGFINAGFSFCICSGVETRTPLSRAIIFATPGTRNSHQPNSVTTFHLGQYTTCYNTDNKDISALLCLLSYPRQTKQTSKLLYMRIIPQTTTCKLHKFFLYVFIYIYIKKCLKCTFISNAAFLIM